jgi:hypothetical protein
VAASYWDQSVNFSCDVKNWKEEFVIQLAQNTGLPDFLLPAASEYLDLTKLGAYYLSADTKAIIHNLIQPFLDNGTSKFQLIDLDEAVVHKSDDSVAIFTGTMNSPPITREAMTLENMVIYNQNNDVLVDAARGWWVPAAPTPDEFKNCQGDSVYFQVISNLVHELVHVRQYRELGADRFVEQYLFEVAATGGDTGGSLEQEARDFKQQLIDMYKTGTCAPL